MMENDQHAEGIKQSIDDILGADTFLKPKKKTDDDIQREKFEKIIHLMQEVEVRGILLGEDLKLDFTSYDEKFYKIIDTLFEMQFGKDACDIIFYYLYERNNPDGSINELIDEEGNKVPLTSPSDLWHLVKKIQLKVGRQKKK